MMKLNSKDIKEMTRILSGEASAEEQCHFYEVLDADPDKRQTFEGIKKEWITASDAMLYKSLDVDSAWQRHKNEYLGFANDRKKSSFSMLWKWVAVVVVAAGLTFYFLNRYISPNEEVASFAAGTHEILPLTMPDGSTVTLNQKSTLTYNFNEELRKVDFKGEAYFEVAADPERPFIIEMDKAYIKVIGTAFNVRTNGSSIHVLVKEGVVEFGLKDKSEKALIASGSSGKIDGRQLSKSNTPDPNSMSWYTKELIFDHSPLTEVFSDISNTYHVAFQYDANQLKNCRLTADFSREELADVLETLRTIFSVDFKRDKHTFIVTGQACELD